MMRGRSWVSKGNFRSAIPKFDTVIVNLQCCHVISHMTHFNKKPVQIARKAARCRNQFEQESPAIADKPARRLRKVCTVYVRAVGL